jgi:hypothetical protein
MIYGVPTLLARRAARIGFLVAAITWLSACETPHVPGLSLSFPETAPGFVGTTRLGEGVSIVPSVDRRPQYIGRPVANTDWLACKADTLAQGALPKLVDERITEAVIKAQVFFAVRSVDPQATWTLAPEIHVFCSQTRGFIVRRVAGLVAIKFTLRKGGAVVWEQTVERVVTDADSDYTGSSVTTVEQAMRRSMADSLRLVLRDALREVDKIVQRS